MSVSSQLPWEKFCQFLEKLSHSAAAVKKKMLSDFMSSYRENIAKRRADNSDAVSCFAVVGLRERHFAMSMRKRGRSEKIFFHSRLPFQVGGASAQNVRRYIYEYCKFAW